MKGRCKAGVDGSFNCVDVRDLAITSIDCVAKGRKGEGYILGNELISMVRLFQLVSEASGTPLVETIIPLEAMIEGAVQSVPESEKEKVRGSMRFGMYNLVRNNNFDSSKAVRDLGYHTRPVSETIHDLVAWLKEIGKIQ